MVRNQAADGPFDIYDDLEGVDTMGDSFATGYALGQDSAGCNNGYGFGGEWIWIILLIALLGGGLGFGGFGGWGGGMGLQGMATRADINEGFALQNITGGIQAIQQGICDSTYALNNAISGGFNGVGMNMMQGFNGVERGFCDLSHQLSDCCCENRMATMQGKYETAIGQNNIIQAGHSDTDRVIAKLDAMENARQAEKIAQLQTENQTLKFQASQSAQNAFITANQEAQTAELIRRLGRDCPVPAYVVPNPNCCYGNPVGVGYNAGYNGSCGCAA